jgi:hypothetical protein
VPLLSTIEPLPPDACERPLAILNEPLSPDTVLPLLNITAPPLPTLPVQPDAT